MGVWGRVYDCVCFVYTFWSPQRKNAEETRGLQDAGSRQKCVGGSRGLAWSAARSPSSSIVFPRTVNLNYSLAPLYGLFFLLCILYTHTHVCLYVCGISLWRPNNRRLFFLPSWSDVPSWPLVPGRHHRSPSPIRRRHRFHRLLHCCQPYPVHQIAVCVCVCVCVYVWEFLCVKIAKRKLYSQGLFCLFLEIFRGPSWKNYHPDQVFICSCCFFRLKNNFFTTLDNENSLRKMVEYIICPCGA